MRILQAHLPTQSPPLKVPKKSKLTLDFSSDEEIDEPGIADVAVTRGANRRAPVSGDVLQCLVDQVSKLDAGMGGMERKCEKLDTKCTALEKDVVLLKKSPKSPAAPVTPKATAAQLPTIAEHVAASKDFGDLLEPLIAGIVKKITEKLVKVLCSVLKLVCW